MNLPVPAQPQSAAALNFGSSQLDMNDFVPPRVKIIQAMSAEYDKKDNPEGTFFNTLTSENYGESLRFIPVHLFKNRVFLVREERRAVYQAMLADAGAPELPDTAEGLTCRSLDMVHGVGSPGIECDACPLSKWDEQTQTPPPCSETYNVAAITELGDLIILGFSRSSAKAGRRLFSMLRLSRGRPWSFMYEATSREEKGERGRYHVPIVQRLNDQAVDAELQKVAADFASQLSGVVIDTTEGGEEAAPPADDGPAPWEQGS